MKILVLSTCAEKLHELEFVRPVEDVLRGKGFSGDSENLSGRHIDFFTKHYSEVSEEDLENCDKVIICGTSLRDDKYLEDLEKFDWLLDFDKPVFGICAGMQILGLVFWASSNLGTRPPTLGRSFAPQYSKCQNFLGDIAHKFLKKKAEIGFYFENADKEFLGLLEGETYEFYHLHNNYISNWEEIDFDIFIKSDCSEHIAQAVQHRKKKLYGVLFHPEVRNKKMIWEFVGL